MYDETAISAEFRALAAQAGHEITDLERGAVPLDASNRDEILARSCVYGYLYDRHFLASQEMLLNELRWLRNTGRPRAPLHVAPPERFHESRDSLLDRLIARFADSSALTKR